MLKYHSILCVCFLLLVACNVHAEEPPFVPLSEFVVMDDLEMTVWATSPLLFNPANMDIDRYGRVWVAEGRNYRRSRKDPEGDRIVVVSDTDGDGKADKSHVFVQEKMMFTPLGVAVIDNKVVVSQPPDLIVYTDVNRNAIFEADIDKREVVLTGWGGKNHDHSLHSVTVGPSGQWIFNTGNAGGHHVKGPDGTEYVIGSFYRGRELSGKKSWDGHVYLGGVAFRMNPDGSGLRVLGHNFRNSYEQIMTSFGDVFQNDNDDPPAARTTWLMEHGDLGYTSTDGKRKWGADRRPGQSVAVAEWRQEDPGIIPAGDVYGGGAPTGIAFVESDQLGKKYRGMLLSCEPARNRVFAYFPKAKGAGISLERSDFVTSNPERNFGGVDFRRGRNVGLNVMFRPSDVAVGPDGAIYVADWFDKRVGGHGTNDKDTYGTIYRIAPKGFKSTIESFDESTIEGAIMALKNPAVNVRNIGFEALKSRGAEAVPAVRKMLKDDNPFIQARAVWLLAQLGPKGVDLVEDVLSGDDAPLRLAAFRALKHIDSEVLAHTAKLSQDDDVAMRREVALAMRDRPFSDTQDILEALAERYDGTDRWYLEAIGIGAVGHESEMYDLVRKKMGSDPSKWSPVMADLAWRFHPEHALKDIITYIESDHSSDEQKKKMLTAVAFMKSADAAQEMQRLATEGPEELKSLAQWWLKNRATNDWKDFLQKDAVVLEDMRVPEMLGVSKGKMSVADVLKLEGNVAKGKALIAACYVCHEVSGKGVAFGPDLTAFGKANGPEVVAKSMVEPSADIAHDFDGLVITTTNNKTIEGLKVAEGDPLVMKVFGGSQVAIPKNQIKSRAKAKQSLMVSAENMGLTAQDVADITAYLRSL